MRPQPGVLWIVFVVLGGIFAMLGNGLHMNSLFLVPFFLFVAALTVNIIVSTRGALFCPRCHYSYVIPVDKNKGA